MRYLLVAPQEQHLKRYFLVAPNAIPLVELYYLSEPTKVYMF